MRETKRQRNKERKKRKKRKKRWKTERKEGKESRKVTYLFCRTLRPAPCYVRSDVKSRPAHLAHSAQLSYVKFCSRFCFRVSLGGLGWDGRFRWMFFFSFAHGHGHGQGHVNLPSPWRVRLSKWPVAHEVSSSSQGKSIFLFFLFLFLRFPV